MPFKVYKSSAGSGKTYNLVREYLCILLKNPSDFKRILAITFTNKAAEEMKSRIIDTLLQIINCDKLPEKNAQIEKLLDDISQSILIEKELIKENAQKSIGLILHNYSDFAVSTIDSFVYSIVRAFAKDLYLPVNFDVELDADVILNQAIDVLISKVGNETEITDLLVRFIDNQIDVQRTLNIEGEIKKIGKYLFNEESIVNIEKLKNLSIHDFFNIQNKLYAAIKQKDAIIKEIARKALELIEKNNISPQAFYYKEKGIYTYFKNIYKLKFDKITFSNANVRKGVEEDKWTSNMCIDEEKIAIENIKQILVAYYYEIQDFTKEDLGIMHLYTLINQNLFPLALLGEISALIEDIKRENNILHISEFNKKIASIVLNEPVPFIYERAGVKFKHIMIDEFQDTSVLQWHNILPLLENALSEKGFTMLVGDAKQAIYRFRDGEVEQFIDLPEIPGSHKDIILKQKENILKNNYNEINLKKNFRSYQQIIDFNNSFFKTIAPNLCEKYSGIYEDAAQENDDKKKGGYVHLHFIERNKQEILEKDNHLKILGIINELITEKKFKLSDIAILCRYNNNADSIARFLIENNIDVVSSESLLLCKSPLINFIISLLQFINKKENTIAAINIATYMHLKNEMNGIELTDLYLQITHDNNFLINELSKLFTDFNYNKYQLMPLYELCEEIIRVFRLDKPDAYIQFFLDVIYNYSITIQNNLSDFLKWWEDNSEKHSVVVSQQIDAVKIMSIHKAKGLQFPVVIYPFANDALKFTKNNIWIEINDDLIPELKHFLVPSNKNLSKTIYKDIYEMEENKSALDLINLLYVVLTRPVEKLFVISEMPPEKSERITVNNLFRDYLQKISLWKDDLRDYTFGVNSIAERKKEFAINKVFPLDKFISSHWQLQ